MYVYDEKIGAWFNKSKRRTVFVGEAQVVVAEVDHFCPWTGTVIAAGNMGRFTVFTSSLCVLIIFTIVVGFTGFIL